MGFNVLRKLFDPNYATKKVDVIRKDANKQLKKSSKSADKITKAAQKGDVSMVLFLVAGGKK